MIIRVSGSYGSGKYSIVEAGLKALGMVVCVINCHEAKGGMHAAVRHMLDRALQSSRSNAFILHEFQVLDSNEQKAAQLLKDHLVFAVETRSEEEPEQVKCRPGLPGCGCQERCI